MKEKHIVITGSTRGIGFGLAKYFVKYGNKVSLNGRKEESVKKAISKLLKMYPEAKIQGFSGNMIMIDDITKLWNKSVEGFGEIDIWINNAGTDQENKLVWEVSEPGIQHVIDLNIL